MEVQIRKGRIEDAKGLGEVLRSVDWFTNIIELPEEELQSQVTRALEQNLSDGSHLILVAETGLGRVLGYIVVHWLPYLFLEGAEGFISEMFVHKAARGTGIGTKLIEMAKQEAHRRGCSRLRLLNGRTRESYQREFYKKNGWREREMMANFIFDVKE
jgi:GNAT superfamily N-acetyltransferase